MAHLPDARGHLPQRPRLHPEEVLPQLPLAVSDEPFPPLPHRLGAFVQEQQNARRKKKREGAAGGNEPNHVYRT